MLQHKQFILIKTAWEVLQCNIRTLTQKDTNKRKLKLSATYAYIYLLIMVTQLFGTYIVLSMLELVDFDILCKNACSELIATQQELSEDCKTGFKVCLNIWTKHYLRPHCMLYFTDSESSQSINVLPLNILQRTAFWGTQVFKEGQICRIEVIGLTLGILFFCKFHIFKFNLMTSIAMNLYTTKLLFEKKLTFKRFRKGVL